MADDGEDRFLTRWARRKRDSARPDRPVEAAAPAPAQPLPEHRGDGEQEAAAAAPPPELPDPDTLGETADFTVFLKKEVPDALRRRALRRLWRLNPVFANLDGLNDYDEDYTDAARVVDGLKTLYQAGRGMVLPEEDAPADAAPAQGEEAVAVAEGEAPSDREAGADQARPQPGAAEEAQEASLTSTSPPEEPGATAEAAAAAPGEVRRASGKTAPSKALARRWGRSDP